MKENSKFSLSYFLDNLRKHHPELYAKINQGKRKNNYVNLMWLFLNYLIISFFIFISLYTGQILVYLLAIFIIGSRMRALENLTHEASHGLLFKNKFLNDSLGTLLCAFPLGTSMMTYKMSHMKHHQFLGHKVYDPDRVRYGKMGMDNGKLLPWQLIFKILGFVFLFNVPKYVKETVKSFIYTKHTMKESKEWLYRWLFIVILISIISVSHSWVYFLCYWIMPFFSTFQLLRFMAETSEHLGLYDHQHILQMARNNLCHPIVRFFLYPHGDAYHLTHHLFPGVPHFNLPYVHHLMMNGDPLYRTAHHCYGYWLALRHKKSTFLDMITV